MDCSGGAGALTAMHMNDDQLIASARAAALKAYAPYSGFHVGCAVESASGEVVTGANMENACYRLGICAEQSALTAAQHAFGLHKVARMAVVGGGSLDGEQRSGSKQQHHLLSGSNRPDCDPAGGLRPRWVQPRPLRQRPRAVRAMRPS